MLTLKWLLLYICTSIGYGLTIATSLIWFLEHNKSPFLWVLLTFMGYYGLVYLGKYIGMEEALKGE